MGQRKLKNYLLDAKFQLKYTSMVVLVTLLLSSVLGKIAYDHSVAQTEIIKAANTFNDLTPELKHRFNQEMISADQKVLFGIWGGVFLLVLALAITGILITHRVVGPAYRLKRLLDDVAAGKIKTGVGLRKGDELQNVFKAYEHMVTKLQEMEKDDIRALQAIAEKHPETRTEVSAIVTMIQSRIE